MNIIGIVISASSQQSSTRGAATARKGDVKLSFHLAPPLFLRRDTNGHRVKQSFGPWIATAFKWLAKARVVRGTALDVFGYMEEWKSDAVSARRSVRSRR